jgi:Transglycosylase SLT domain
LHRYATELDLGPPAAYGWLQENHQRFGFVWRYRWEPWHYGFAANPRDRQHPALYDQGSWEPPGGDHGRVKHGLPSFVPPRFHDPIARAALRWNVPMNLLAAQLYAESGFNPFARSPAGAEGIAQFMPGTADAYGLDNPFDAEGAIDAQAHLMSDLLRQFDGKVALALAGYNAGAGAVERYGGVPPYPETRAYVTKILGLLGGAGDLAVAGGFEVRLVE